MRRIILAVSISAALLVAAGSADASTALAHTASVLVLSRATNGTEGDVAAAMLRSLGYTTTLTETLPAKLSSYSSIWSIRAYEGFSDEEEAALEAYVKSGGHLYLTGERPCCEELDASDQAIARAVLKNQEIVVGQQGDIPGEMTFNPEAEDGITTAPNRLNNFLAVSPGGIAGIGAPEGKNVLASNGTTATGAAFDQHEMADGKGRLVIYMDIDWLAGPSAGVIADVRKRSATATTDGASHASADLLRAETTRVQVIENIEDFLEGTPTRLPASADYVGLGDSYASGLGSFSYLPGTTGKKGCYRATNGYIEDISIEYELGLDFAACSGATIGNLWEGKNAQLKQVGPETRYITLSVGGDDVGFSSVLESCIGGLIAKGGKGCAGRDNPAAEEALGWLRYGREPGTYELPGGHASSKNLERLPSLQELYESIVEQAPGAEFVIVGYPKLFETGTAEFNDCQVGTAGGIDKLTINAADVEWIDEKTDELDGVIEEAAYAAREATGADIRFADPRGAFMGHGLCDAETSFINPLLFDSLKLARKNESFHPTTEGQEALRQVIEEAGSF